VLGELEAKGGLTVGTVEPIRLVRTKPPGTPSPEELEWQEVPVPAQPGEEEAVQAT
jgi:hypothetical protein